MIASVVLPTMSTSSSASSNFASSRSSPASVVALPAAASRSRSRAQVLSGSTWCASAGITSSKSRLCSSSVCSSISRSCLTSQCSTRAGRNDDGSGSFRDRCERRCTLTSTTPDLRRSLTRRVHGSSPRRARGIWRVAAGVWMKVLRLLAECALYVCACARRPEAEQQRYADEVSSCATRHQPRLMPDRAISTQADQPTSAQPTAGAVITGGTKAAE